MAPEAPVIPNPIRPIAPGMPRAFGSQVWAGTYCDDITHG
jgi:hypothetical protein